MKRYLFETIIENHGGATLRVAENPAGAWVKYEDAVKANLSAAACEIREKDVLLSGKDAELRLLRENWDHLEPAYKAEIERLRAENAKLKENTAKIC